MSKFLLNLLVQNSKPCQIPKFSLKFRKKFFLCFSRASKLARPTISAQSTRTAWPPPLLLGLDLLGGPTHPCTPSPSSSMLPPPPHARAPARHHAWPPPHLPLLLTDADTATPLPLPFPHHCPTSSWQK
jgi:hypothetical protein